MIAIRCTRAKAFHSIAFINQERKLGDRRRLDTVVVSTINYADQGLGDVAALGPDSSGLGAHRNGAVPSCFAGLSGHARQQTGACFDVDSSST